MKAFIGHSFLVASLLGGALYALDAQAEGVDKNAINAIREEIVGTKTAADVSLPKFESTDLVTGIRPPDIQAAASEPKNDDDLKKRLAELAEAEKSLEAKLASHKSDSAPVGPDSKPKAASVVAPLPSSDSGDAKAKLSIPDKQEVQPKSKEVVQTVTKKDSKVSSVVAEVTSLEQSRAKLQKELSASQGNVRRLAGELDEMRSRLMIAETEVERLSALLEEKNASKLRSLNIPTRRIQPSVRDTEMEPLHGGSVDSVVQEKMTSDMPVATVIAEKAHLRTAPGEQNSPLMTISQGTRLAVETRQGGWLRVITPTGSRAWISSSVVTFGRGKTPPKMSEGLAEGGEEDRAFQSLQTGLQ